MWPDVTTVQDIQSLQSQHEGRLVENKRRVVQVIGLEVQDASRGQRSHLLQERELFSQAGEEKIKAFLNMRNCNAQVRRQLHYEEFVMASLKERFPRIFRGGWVGQAVRSSSSGSS